MRQAATLVLKGPGLAGCCCLHIHCLFLHRRRRICPTMQGGTALTALIRASLRTLPSRAGRRSAPGLPTTCTPLLPRNSRRGPPASGHSSLCEWIPCRPCLAHLGNSLHGERQRWQFGCVLPACLGAASGLARPASLRPLTACFSPPLQLRAPQRLQRPHAAVSPRSRGQLHSADVH